MQKNIEIMEQALDQLITLARMDKERFEPMRKDIVILLAEVQDLKREMSENAWHFPLFLCVRLVIANGRKLQRTLHQKKSVSYR